MLVIFLSRVQRGYKCEIYFQKYGVVKSVAVMKDRDGNSRGFGFVALEKHEDAQKAVEELNGTEVEGMWRLVCSFTSPKICIHPGTQLGRVFSRHADCPLILLVLFLFLAIYLHYVYKFG